MYKMNLLLSRAIPASVVSPRFQLLLTLGILVSPTCDAAWLTPTQAPYAYSTTGALAGQMPRVEMAAESVKKSLPSLSIEPHASCKSVTIFSVLQAID